MENQSESKRKETINPLQDGLTQSELIISELKSSEQRYRHFFEKSPAMIYVIDMRGIFININDAGAKMLGYGSASEVIGKRFEDFFLIERDDLRRYRNILETTGAIQESEAKMKRVDGALRHVQFSAAFRKTLTGKAVGYEGFVIDITPRKETEKRLAESEIKYRTVLDNSLAAIYMFQDGGCFSYVNPRMVSILGYDSAGEIIGKPFWETVAPVDRDMVKARGLARERGEINPRRYRFLMIKKNGEEICVDMQASHASYLGRPAVVGNFIDVTRETKAEEQVRRLTGKLIEAIEEERRSLANDIHDEFGRALTLLQFDVESLQKVLPPGSSESSECCTRMMAQIQSLAQAVRDTTSRLRPDMLDHFGLVPTLQWYINDFKARKPDIRIVFQSVGLKRRIPPAVELVLYRVFQEGLNNISKHARASHIALQLTYSHPDIIFMIRDNGQGFVVSDDGMPLESRRKGIGLLSMNERVKALGGSATIHSTLGKGTLLRVKIPIHESQSDEPH